MKTLASILTRTFREWIVPIFAVAVALGLVLCSTAAFAQSGAGSIQGTVTDSTGAVISGASIHVAQQATNEVSDTKSNDVGFYQVPNLFTGSYDVTITAPGMKTYKTTVELLVAQAAADQGVTVLVAGLGHRDHEGRILIGARLHRQAIVEVALVCAFLAVLRVARGSVVAKHD